MLCNPRANLDVGVFMDVAGKAIIAVCGSIEVLHDLDSWQHYQWGSVNVGILF